MKHSALPFPILSVGCMSLAYGLLGWRLASISALWIVNAWVVAIVIVIVLTWWGNYLGGLVRIGPRSLLAIFFLSIGFTLAISYADPFALGLILMLTIFWSRLEMQIRGMNRAASLAVLASVIGLSLAVGWYLGQNKTVLELLQSPAQWLHPF